MDGISSFLQDVPTAGWLGGLTALVALSTLAFRVLRFLYRLTLGTAEFLADWSGEPARPGVPARLGILERLSRVEAELKTNGGSSLRDQTNRIEHTLNAHIEASGDHR